jgi:hypothetical protein
MQSAQPKPLFRAPRAIFWTAFALRIATILIGHTYRIRTDDNHFNFAFEAGRIARSLVTGQGYANPFDGPSGPTAWLPPTYPLLIALSFKLFGIYTRGAAFFLLACNSLFSALIAPAIYEIAARIFDANSIARRASKHVAPVALWSAWLWAIYPAFLQYAIHWLWEMSLTTCLFTWALVLALRLRSVGERVQGSASSVQITSSSDQLTPSKPWALSPGPWALLGILWGLIALSNASLLLVFPASILWILYPSNLTSPTLKPLQKNLLGAALACLTFALTLSPWIIRNEHVLHAFIPTRDNFGVELNQSMLIENDGFPWGTSLPLAIAAPEFQRFVRMGEIPYAQAKATEAKAAIHAHPDRFIRWTIQRFFFFWDGTPHSADRHPAQEFFRRFSYSFLSVCGILGLLLMLKRRVPAAALFAIVFALVPLPYYLVTVQPRFRHPIEPLIAILGVYLFRSTEPRQRQGA